MVTTNMLNQIKRKLDDDIKNGILGVSHTTKNVWNSRSLYKKMKKEDFSTLWNNRKKKLRKDGKHIDTY